MDNSMYIFSDTKSIYHIKYEAPKNHTQNPRQHQNKQIIPRNQIRYVALIIEI